MAKQITLTTKAQQWARDNGWGRLIDDLEMLVESYQTSWRAAQKNRIINRKIETLDKKIKALKKELSEEEAKL